jgi:ferritin-like protein
MASEGYHEPIERLDEGVIDRHRAITSIMEELEAVDWYDQRVTATSDPDLAAVLGHNRDEEKEHAAMTLEWLRRKDATLDKHLRTYLFTEGSIVGLEDEAMGRDGGGGDGTGAGTTGLGIGSLKSAPTLLGGTP